MVGELKDGEVREYEIHPEDFGLTMATTAALQVADAGRVEGDASSRVLANEHGPARDIVLLNAGAALYAANVAPTLADGVRRAREASPRARRAPSSTQFIAFATRQAEG